MLPALGRATLLCGNTCSHTQATVLQVTEHQSHFTDWKTEVEVEMFVQKAQTSCRDPSRGYVSQI